MIINTFDIHLKVENEADIIKKRSEGQNSMATKDQIHPKNGDNRASILGLLIFLGMMKKGRSSDNVNIHIDNAMFFQHQSKRKLKDDYNIGKVIGKGRLGFGLSGLERGCIWGCFFNSVFVILDFCDEKLWSWADPVITITP